jgi:hypothetical protein
MGQNLLISLIIHSLTKKKTIFFPTRKSLAKYPNQFSEKERKCLVILIA